MAFRVPTPNVSVVDLTCRLEKPVSVVEKALPTSKPAPASSKLPSLPGFALSPSLSSLRLDLCENSTCCGAPMSLLPPFHPADILCELGSDHLKCISSQAKYDDIKRVVKAAADGPLKGILAYTEDQVSNS